MDRLLVADGDGWRVPREDELPSLMLTTPSEGDAAHASLFSIPAHMSTRFWDMLSEQAAAGTGDFVRFSDDLVDFLTFKELPPPKESVCELLLQDARGAVSTSDVWAVVNVGELPVLLGWPRLRLRLLPGEGCRIAPGVCPDVVPPTADEMNVLLVIRAAPSPASLDASSQSRPAGTG